MKTLVSSPGSPLQRRLLPALIPALLLLLILNTTAHAKDEGISVTGTATVKAKPTELELTGTIIGEGELANDASVKFQDTRKKALAAIDNLKFPDLTVESLGSTVHEVVDPQAQMRIAQGQSTETPKVRVQISERVKLTLKNIDKMENAKVLENVLKLIDTGRDAGLTIGAPPATNYYQIQMQMQNAADAESLTVFKIPDTQDMQAKAYQQAIADARDRAQRIATLTGIKLGKVLSVQDNGVTQTNAGNAHNQNENDRTIEKEATSSTLADIPVTVKVNVQFEIAKD